MDEENERLANILRLKGNDYFRKRRYYNAIECYTKSLQYHLYAATLSNRAQAFLFIKCNEKALMDAKKAICLDRYAIKANYRHAVALINLHLYEMAMDDLKRILDIDANNKEANKLYNEIKDKKSDDNVRLQCVNKCVSIRSQQPLKHIPIHHVITSNHTTTRNQHSSISSPTIPSTIPNTSYQLLCEYSTLKQYPDRFAQYFIQINSTNYTTLLDDTIESDMLDILIDGYYSIINMNNCEQILQSLISLANVRRFDVISMFIDEQHKQQLRSIMEQYKVNDSRVKLIEELYHL